MFFSVLFYVHEYDGRKRLRFSAIIR